MAQKIVFKAIALSRDLAVKLENSIKGSSIVKDSDSDRFPTLQITVNNKSCFVKISTDFDRSEEDGHVDALGMGQRVYAPHKIEFIRENSATADASSLDMLNKVLAEISKLGTRVLVSEGASVEDAADFAAALALSPVVVSEIKSDVINPLTKQM